MMKIKNTFSRNKNALVATGLIALGSLEASANVTYTSLTGFAGTFDLTPYYTAVGIIVTAISVIAAVGLALRQFRKVS